MGQYKHRQTCLVKQIKRNYSEFSIIRISRAFQNIKKTSDWAIKKLMKNLLLFAFMNKMYYAPLFDIFR